MPISGLLNKFLNLAGSQFPVYERLNKVSCRDLFSGLDEMMLIVCTSVLDHKGSAPGHRLQIPLLPPTSCKVVSSTRLLWPSVSLCIRRDEGNTSQNSCEDMELYINSPVQCMKLRSVQKMVALFIIHSEVFCMLTRPSQMLAFIIFTIKAQARFIIS